MSRADVFSSSTGGSAPDGIVVGQGGRNIGSCGGTRAATSAASPLTERAPAASDPIRSDRKGCPHIFKLFYRFFSIQLDGCLAKRERKEQKKREKIRDVRLAKWEKQRQVFSYLSYLSARLFLLFPFCIVFLLSSFFSFYPSSYPSMNPFSRRRRRPGFFSTLSKY